MGFGLTLCSRLSPSSANGMLHKYVCTQEIQCCRFCVSHYVGFLFRKEWIMTWLKALCKSLLTIDKALIQYNCAFDSVNSILILIAQETTFSPSRLLWAFHQVRISIIIMFDLNKCKWIFPLMSSASDSNLKKLFPPFQRTFHKLSFIIIFSLRDYWKLTVGQNERKLILCCYRLHT